MGQSPGDVYVPMSPWAGQVGQPLLSLLCCSSPGGHMVQNKEISLPGGLQSMELQSQTQLKRLSTHALNLSDCSLTEKIAT